MAATANPRAWMLPVLLLCGGFAAVMAVEAPKPLDPDALLAKYQASNVDTTTKASLEFPDMEVPEETTGGNSYDYNVPKHLEGLDLDWENAYSALVQEEVQMTAAQQCTTGSGNKIMAVPGEKCIARTAAKMRAMGDKELDKLNCHMKKGLMKALAREEEKSIRCGLKKKLRRMNSSCIPAQKRQQLLSKFACEDYGESNPGMFLPGMTKTHCSISMGHKRNEEWSTLVTWHNFQQVCDTGLSVCCCDTSLLVMTANAHVKPESGNPASWIYSTFFVDGVQPEPGGADWGQYHTYAWVSRDWTPMNFVQQYIVMEGCHGVSLQARIDDGPWRVNGLAIEAACIPFAGKNDWGNGEHTHDEKKFDGDGHQLN